MALTKANERLMMANKSLVYLHSTVRVMLAVSGWPTPLSAEQVYTPKISINIDIAGTVQSTKWILPESSLWTEARVRQLFLGHVLWADWGIVPT